MNKTDDFDIDLKDIDLSFTDTVDPLDEVPITGDLEADSKAEVGAMLQAFKDRNKQEEKRNMAAVDSEYWFAVCFQSREQKDAFLRAVGLWDHGDKYLDGKVVARKLGIKIPPAQLRYQGEKPHKRISERCKPIRKIGGDSECET